MDDLYEDFFKKLEPVKPQPEQPLVASVQRDELGLLPLARKLILELLECAHPQDLCRTHPEYTLAFKALKPSSDLKSVSDMTFLEFWEQNKVGPVKKYDQGWFHVYEEMWRDMPINKRLVVLRDWKEKYKREMFFTVILKDAIDPYWQQREQFENFEGSSDDPN